MPEGIAALARRAHKKTRERSPVLKGLLRIRRYHQQETPYALQEVEQISWLQFGEAYSALRGWRPIPAALLSHSVLHCSGTEDISLPTQRLPATWSRPTQGKIFPDKHRSIGKKSRPVKSLDTSRWKTLRKFGVLAPALPAQLVHPKRLNCGYCTTLGFWGQFHSYATLSCP